MGHLLELDDERRRPTSPSSTTDGAGDVADDAVPEPDARRRRRGLRVAVVVRPLQRPHHRAAARRRPARPRRRCGVADDDVAEAWVPGAFELPLAAKRFAESGPRRRRDLPRRGDPGRHRRTSTTSPASAPRASSRPALDTGVPVVFGVLTTETSSRRSTAAEGAGRPQGRGGGRAPRSRWPTSWRRAPAAGRRQH